MNDDSATVRFNSYSCVCVERSAHSGSSKELFPVIPELRSITFFCRPHQERRFTTGIPSCVCDFLVSYLASEVYLTTWVPGLSYVDCEYSLEAITCLPLKLNMIALQRQDFTSMNDISLSNAKASSLYAMRTVPLEESVRRL